MYNSILTPVSTMQIISIEPYFTDKWAQVKVQVPNMPRPITSQVFQYSITTEDGSLLVWNIANNIYSFGKYKQHCDMHHGNPWMWSSRAEVLGYYLGIQLIDVLALDHYSKWATNVAVRYIDIEPLLPANVKIVSHPEYGNPHFEYV